MIKINPKLVKSVSRRMKANQENDLSLFSDEALDDYANENLMTDEDYDTQEGR